MTHKTHNKEIPVRVLGGAPGVVAAMADPRFELIPIRGAEDQSRHLPRGARVTVTCSPALGLENTLDLAERLAEKGFRVVPHLSARLVRDGAHLCSLLRRMERAGIREAFVVGGDLRRPAGKFHSSLSLLREMEGFGHGLERIGVAAYPESHPLISDEDLVSALREKERYATYAVTQICFDPDTLTGWVSKLRERGAGLPVYVGLAGVAERRKLLQISMKIGVGDSARFLRKQSGLVGRLVKPGGYRPDALVDALAPYFGDGYYGLAGFHINTFNQVEDTERWRREALELLERRWFSPEADLDESPA